MDAPPLQEQVAGYATQTALACCHRHRAQAASRETRDAGVGPSSY